MIHLYNNLVQIIYHKNYLIFTKSNQLGRGNEMDKMGICLISVSHDLHCFGIRRLSSFLKSKGVPVRLLFITTPFEKLSRVGLDNILKKCDGFKVIGISFMSNFKIDAFQISDALKAKNKDKIIVMGGVHTTHNPEECLKKCDFAVIGEGEHALYDLLTDIEKGNKDYKINNLYYIKDKQLVKNPLVLLDDYDDLPFLDFNLDDDYVYEYGKMVKLDKRLLRCYFGTNYSVMTSYGCPFSCSYCCNNKYNELFGYRNRLRTLSKVIDELVEMKKRLPFIEGIRIEDDLSFMHNIDVLNKFMGDYKKKIGLPFDIIGGHPNFITEEKMEIAFNSGLRQIVIGVQSGNDNTNKIFRRNVPNKKMVEIAKLVSKYTKGRVSVLYEVILDNPWESEEDRMDTVNLLMKFPLPFRLALYSLTPFEGTEINEYLKKLNIEEDSEKQYLDYKEDYINLCNYMTQVNFLSKKQKRYIINQKGTSGEKLLRFFLLMIKRNRDRLNHFKLWYKFFVNAVLKFNPVLLNYYFRKFWHEFNFHLRIGKKIQ